jgi:hypothetical protein
MYSLPGNPSDAGPDIDTREMTECPECQTWHPELTTRNTYPCQHGEESAGIPICLLRPCSECVTRCVSCSCTFCPAHIHQERDGRMYCFDCRGCGDNESDDPQKQYDIDHERN